jgi:hypothetical protein
MKRMLTGLANPVEEARRAIAPAGAPVQAATAPNESMSAI